MNIIGPRRLVDVLADWGLHEAEAKLRAGLRPDLVPPPTGPGREAAGVEIALMHRSPLISRILAARPCRVIAVEIAPTEASALFIADGRRLDVWTDAVLAESGESGAHVRDLAARSEPIAGPLVCTARLETQRPLAPVIIYDGWHRAAGWLAHARAGREYAISGDLVLIEGSDPMLTITTADG